MVTTTAQKSSTSAGPEQTHPGRAGPDELVPSRYALRAAVLINVRFRG